MAHLLLLALFALGGGLRGSVGLPFVDERAADLPRRRRKVPAAHREGIELPVAAVADAWNHFALLVQGVGAADQVDLDVRVVLANVGEAFVGAHA